MLLRGLVRNEKMFTWASTRSPKYCVSNLPDDYSRDRSKVKAYHPWVERLGRLPIPSYSRDTSFDGQQLQP